MEKFWILKTREDIHRDSGKYHDYWDRFKSESVVAIGWSVPANSPFTLPELRNHIRREYYSDPKDALKVYPAAQSVWKFATTMSIDDKIFLCRGYPATMGDDKDIYIYGFAKVKSNFYRAENSNWFKNKRKAKILAVEEFVKKGDLVNILGLPACLQTIHEIHKDGKDRFDQLLRWFGIKDC